MAVRRERRRDHEGEDVDRQCDGDERDDELLRTQPVLGSRRARRDRDLRFLGALGSGNLVDRTFARHACSRTAALTRRGR